MDYSPIWISLKTAGGNDTCCVLSRTGCGKGGGGAKTGEAEDPPG